MVGRHAYIYCFTTVFLLFYCVFRGREGGRVNLSDFSAYVIKVWPLSIFYIKNELVAYCSNLIFLNEASYDKDDIFL